MIPMKTYKPGTRFRVMTMQPADSTGADKQYVLVFEVMGNESTVNGILPRIKCVAVEEEG
jgi:hypothetical protein